ncbi:putative leucine-rich repeat-containing protein DDB_G0290503 [Pseudorasbora parva]|uniref:putative leucine-rich repeat-containing protein DDB_G0290503 n=1 Tax=Pseudorasbora parva TaxID=51549 RepID=UPI00351EEFFB
MNMMRFILDCLRPARARAAAAARDTELQAQVEGTSDDNQIKGLKDEVHMEEETLQTVKTLRRDTQETKEKLEERKTQLREELKVIYDLQKQEREVLQSLQEEQQELEQTVQQYDTELCAAAEDLLQLQREVAYAKAHAESLHVQISPLQDVFEEIVQVKKKLGELVAGLIAGESIMTEMTEDAHCEILDQELVEKADVVESECDQVYCEKIMSKQEGEEVDYVEQDNTAEELDKLQYSTENLKSSGSSSFTEITLTEVKEEDVMFISTTPQSDSSDMEKEDFEIIQASQATNRQFDFFHPNPFTDGDVFGEDHFPKVDITEQLPRDPFKGTDPFATDTLLVNMSEDTQCEDDFITAENSLPDTVHYPLQSAGKDYGTFNNPINRPLGDFKQSTEELDCVSVPNESRSLEYCRYASSGVQINATQDQNHDAEQPEVSKEAQFNEEYVHESGSSHSSTVFNSFDADSSIFAEAEEEEDRVEVQDGSSFTKRANSLCGLQRIIAGSYTGFPLSPCDPEPLPGISDINKIFEHHMTQEHQNAVNDKDCCHSQLGNNESFSNDHSSGPPCEQLHDINSNASTFPSICASQPSALDVNDYKYGDMFFFTVRLDPGSPELHNHSSVCPEPNEIKKDDSNDQLPWKDTGLSPEFKDIDEFECCSPKPEDTEQHSQISNDQNNYEKVEQEIMANSDPSKCNEILAFDHEKADLHIPCLIFEDTDAYQSQHNSDIDEFEYCSPKPEDTDQHNQISNDQNNYNEVEQEITANSDPSTCNEILVFDHEKADLHIPCLIFEDSDSYQSQHNSDIDEFECCSPKPEDTYQHSQISNDQNNYEKVEQEITANSDPSKFNEIIASDSEKVDLQIPCLTFEDSDAYQSPHNSDIDEFECCSPNPEDTEQNSQNSNDQNNYEKVEQEITTNSDPSKCNEILGFDSERADLHIPCLTFEDSDAYQSLNNSEWNDQWKANPAAKHFPDSSILDTKSSAPNSTVQDPFCLLSKTDESTADQVYVCEQLIPETSISQQHKLSSSETLAMSKFELQYFDPFSPIPAEPVDCGSELEEMNTVVHEAPRLDSGYHEVDTPTPFSPEPAYKSKYSIELQGQGSETRQSDSEIHAPDPFSPESVDTGIFDSETENCESGNMITKCHFFSPQQVYTDLNNPEDKQISFINTVSCDMLSDHLSGSELDDCYLFGSFPSNEESYACSSEENGITGSIQDGSNVSGESKPRSMVSNASNSNQVIHSGSLWSASEMSLPNAEVFDPMKNIFDFNTGDVGSFAPNISPEAEEATHCGEKVIKKVDLAEIDYFCSELSKMVSSSSSDSVQQSVAEMLFGSDPDTTSFYPWDFEKQQHSC